MMIFSADLLRLVLAVSLLLLLIGISLFVRRHRIVAIRLGDDEVLRALVGTELSTVPWRRLTLVLVAGTALGLSLLDTALIQSPRDFRGPVVFVLDASSSMLAEESGVRRIDVQRELARNLTARLSTVPIGIVTFAGRAFSLTPPTRDLQSVDMYLAAVDPTIVTQSGSALGAALRQGMGLLEDLDGSASGTLVLFSDGDETEDAEAALTAADLARRSGAIVHVVGVGSDDGAVVPLLDPATGEASEPMRDESGEIVVSRRSDTLLRDIARMGGGTYVAGARDDAIPSLFTAIGDEMAVSIPDRSTPWFVWPALAAFILLLVEPASRSKREKR